MKIEMGESLMYSWLRHVKECQIAQLNWKASTVDREVLGTLEAFYEGLKEPFSLKTSLKQFLTQAEIDVLGISVQGTQHELYAVDIAFHEGGLGYRNIIDTVAKKLIRSALTLYTQFGQPAGTVVFATPKVRDVVATDLHRRLSEIRNAFEAAGFGFEFVFLYNESFQREVLDTVVRKARGVKDTSDLFIRAAKLLGMFDGALNEFNFKEAVDSEVDEVAEIEVLGEVDNPKLSEAELKNMTCKELVDYYQENPQALKIGKLAQFFFDKLERESKLQTFFQQFPNTRLGSYPLLLPVDADTDPQQLRKGGTSQNRYYDRIYQGNGQGFLLCSQWYPKHISVLATITKDFCLN